MDERFSDLYGVLKIFEDQSGRIWVARRGLNRYDPETDRFVSYEYHSSDPRWTAPFIVKLYEDRSGLFWVVTVSQDTRGVEQPVIQLGRFDPEAGQFTHWQPDPDDPTTPNIPINDIYGEDSEGQLWFPSANAGMDRYNPGTGTFTHYAHNPDAPRSISSHRIVQRYTDRTGLLWFGSTDGGLSKVDPHPLKSSTAFASLPTRLPGANRPRSGKLATPTSIPARTPFSYRRRTATRCGLKRAYRSP